MHPTLTYESFPPREQRLENQYEGLGYTTLGLKDLTGELAVVAQRPYLIKSVAATASTLRDNLRVTSFRLERTNGTVLQLLAGNNPPVNTFAFSTGAFGRNVDVMGPAVVLPGDRVVMAFARDANACSVTVSAGTLVDEPAYARSLPPSDTPHLQSVNAPLEVRCSHCGQPLPDHLARQDAGLDA